MFKYALCVLVSLGLNISVVQAAALCEQKSVLKKAKDYQELVIPETDFNAAQAQEALKHFSETLPALIDSSKQIKDLRENPMYYIKTPKSATILGGYQLLQAYRIALLEAQLLTAKDKKNKTKAALKAVDKAKQAFCAFYDMNMIGAD